VAPSRERNGSPQPDIEIAVAASGRDLRFHERPHVVLHAEEVSSSRTGLPRPVRPGVTYRWFRASTRLASRLAVRRSA